MSLVIHSETAPPKRRSCLRRFVWLLFFCFLLSVFCFVFRSPLLIGLAHAWVVNEPVTHANAIVVLGGGIESRPFAAAQLFQSGVAPLVLYMDVQPGPAEELGVVLPEREVTHRLLLSNGVPETALVAIGQNVSSTYEESVALRKWAESAGAKSVVIPTDIFHTRRVRWLFQKQLADTSGRVQVVAVNPIRYSITNWWQREEGLIAFQNEIVKSAYYHLKY